MARLAPIMLVKRMPYRASRRVRRGAKPGATVARSVAGVSPGIKPGLSLEAKFINSSCVIQKLARHVRCSLSTSSYPKFVSVGGAALGGDPQQGIGNDPNAQRVREGIHAERVPQSRVHFGGVQGSGHARSIAGEDKPLNPPMATKADKKL